MRPRCSIPADGHTIYAPLPSVSADIYAGPRCKRPSRRPYNICAAPKRVSRPYMRPRCKHPHRWAMIIYATLQACQPDIYAGPAASVPAEGHIIYACSKRVSRHICAPAGKRPSRWPYNICMLQACQPTYMRPPLQASQPKATINIWRRSKRVSPTYMRPAALQAFATADGHIIYACSKRVSRHICAPLQACQPKPNIVYARSKRGVRPTYMLPRAGKRASPWPS